MYLGLQQTANPVVFQNPSASPASVFHEYQSLKLESGAVYDLPMSHDKLWESGGYQL